MTLEQIIELCQWYYSLPGNSAGGSLHIVLDDGNTDDSCIDFCEQWAEDHGDVEAQVVIDALRTLTENERDKLYDALWGREFPYPYECQLNMRYS